jgi:hypothetical protein
MRKASRVSVKQQLLYSLKCLNLGLSAKSATVIDFEFTSECKFKTTKTHFHIYLKKIKQQRKRGLWILDNLLTVMVKMLFYCVYTHVHLCSLTITWAS